MSMIYYLRATDGSQIDELLKDPESIEEFLDEESESEIDLDKAWHGIHYLLTGSAWEGAEPVCYLLSGGQEVGDIDVGYGPARAITKEQTAQFEDALSKMDLTEFRKRFDPKAMMRDEIYPTIWDRDPKEDDSFGYLCSYFGELKTFLKTAKENKQGLITWLS